MLFLVLLGTGFLVAQQQTLGCPGCTVSSNPSENAGYCMECIEGGDICTSVMPGPSCDGNQD